MKLQKEPIDVDFYIVNKPLSEAEKKEVTLFIQNEKKKRKMASKKANARKKHKLPA